MRQMHAKEHNANAIDGHTADGGWTPIPDLWRVQGFWDAIHAPRGVQHWINQFVAEGAYPFMVPILRGFVLHFATPLAFLVDYGELPLKSRWFLESSCARPALSACSTC
jgi:hypothetical protein